MIRSATVYEELAYFALSRVPIPKQASLPARSAAFVGARSGAASEETARPFDEDRPALLALAQNGVLTAQHLPRLFPDVEAFLATAKKSVRELSTDDGADADCLLALQSGDARLAELLLCDMALAASSFEATEGAEAEARTTSALPAVKANVRALAATAPQLASLDIVVTAELARAGRGFLRRARPLAYVGLAAGEDAAAATHATLVALHELAVMLGPADHAIAERAAIDACAMLVQKTAFRDAFAERIASLDLSAIATREAAEDATRAVLARLMRA